MLKNNRNEPHLSKGGVFCFVMYLSYMKIIITKQQYKNLAFSLLENIVGDLKLDSKYEQGEAFIKVFDTYGDNIMDVWVRKSAIPKGCKKELNVSIEISELIFSYLPLVRKKIFSEVFLEYFYMKTKYKCDCVDFYYPIDKKDEDDDYVYRKFQYKKKKKKLKESIDKKQNVFSGQQSNNSNFMFIQTGAKGYYQVVPFNSFTDQFYDYVSSLGKDSESEVMDYLINRTYIEASGEYNRIHFREGLHPKLQGIGLGYKIYKEFIEFLGYGSSSENATTESKRVWKKLLESSDFYGVYGDGENVLIVSKNWKGDIVSLIKSFISKKCQGKVINISNSLLSDYPEFNNYFENPINESVDNSNVVEQLLELENIRVYYGYKNRIYNRDGEQFDDAYVSFELPNGYKYERTVRFKTIENKVIGVYKHGDFAGVVEGFKYVPEEIVNDYFIEKLKTHLENVLPFEYRKDNDSFIP